MVFGGAGSGFANPPVGNEGIIQRIAFKSDDYVPGVSGWCIFRNGNVEFNSGTFRGTVTGGAFEGSDFVLNPAGLFLYNGTPAFGNLIYSVTNANGTDPYGNDYYAYQLIGLSSQKQILIGTDSNGSGLIKFLIPGFDYGGIEAFTNTGGSGTFAGVNIFGPSQIPNTSGDYVDIGFNSSDTVSSANMQFTWYDLSNTDHLYAGLDYTGFNIYAGRASARDPSTGTSKTNPAQTEAWHPVFLDGGWTAINTPYYRISACGTYVIVVGSIKYGTAFTGGQDVNSTHLIPAAWCPAKTWNIGGTNIYGRAGAEISATGKITAEAGGISVTECDLAGIYPLGL